MKTELNQEQLALLAEVVKNWLKERQLITDDQPVEMTLRFPPPKSQVTVIVAEPENKLSIEKVIAQMYRGVRIRLENALNNADVTDLDQLISFKASDLLKWRNISKLTVTSLGEALGKVGLSDCPLAQDIRKYFGSDKPTLKGEAERSEVRSLNDDDWTKMIASLEKVKRVHTKTQLQIVKALMNSGNKLTSASELFTGKIQASWWKSLIHLINLRWSSSNLPYRMRFTPAPTPQSKWAGQVQIGCYIAPQ